MEAARNQQTKRPWAIAAGIVVLVIVAVAVFFVIEANYSTTGENPPGGQRADSQAPRLTEVPESAKPPQNRESGGRGQGGLGQ